MSDLPDGQLDAVAAIVAGAIMVMILIAGIYDAVSAALDRRRPWK